MNETRRTHLEAIPPVPEIDSSLPALGLRPSFALSMSHRSPLASILGAIVSVQAGAALAKGLFPALGPIGTVGLRVVLSAIMLMAAFRPRLR